MFHNLIKVKTTKKSGLLPLFFVGLSVDRIITDYLLR